MGLPQFEYLHGEQSTSERQQQSHKRRYLLMAGIFGVVLIISTIIIAVVVAINYQEENTCFDGLKCMPIKDCEGQMLGDITFPCGESKICCKPKLSIRTEIHEKTKAERLRKRDQMMQLCGNILLTDKIAEGRDSTLGEFPWMAILGYSTFLNATQEILEFKCGGTLISDQYILTAAHCVNESLTTAYLGTVNLTSVRLNQTECIYYEDGSKICVYPTKLRVTNIIKHPDFNNTNLKNDIALLKLDRKIDNDEEFIKRICLPFNLNIDRSLGWRNFSMTGWGLTETHGGIHNILQAVNKVSPWMYDRCTDRLTHSIQLLPITKKQICATGDNFSEACSGDSGGPLFYTYENYTQVGIISFKPLYSCGTEKQPTIFTRLDGYLDWILDNLDI